MTEQRIPPTSPPRRRAQRPTVMMLVIYAVSAMGLLALVMIGLLAWNEKPVPDALATLPGIALTGLVALLAKRDADS